MADEIQYTCGDTFYDISSSKVLLKFHIIQVVNCEAECEEENNYGEYFPYCEDCSASVDDKRGVKKINL
ncbi:42_t:CDS:2 [Rhizophagus irregularis]|nr:42_t:CDS:2 [Rhizophagus irregularis]